MDGELTQKAARRRKLTDEEVNLWLQVAKTIQRRPGAVLPDAPSATFSSSPVDHSAPESRRRAAPTALSYSLPVSSPAQHVQPLVPLERRLKQQLLRGRSSVDQVLDLHGLRQIDAHQRLRNFLSRAQIDGAKIALVITGKGRVGGSGHEFDFEGGVLRRLVPHWLRAPEMRGMVIGFEEAGSPHGGSGALYVRIRKHERGR